VTVPKQVNANWSVDLIKEVPPVAVAGNIAVCEGGPSEALGHPKIYINLVNTSPVDCNNYISNTLDRLKIDRLNLL